MLSKVCESCGKVFYKPSTRSVKSFLLVARFCSYRCRTYGQEGFYKHWKGKKRPELLKTGAKNTMFGYGQSNRCPPEKLFRKHGMHKNPFYRRWVAMGQRCNNPNFKQYKDYGGRGIKVEWGSFEDFRADMYCSYLEHLALHGSLNTTIERINNDGNYSKTNCKWATRKEQMMNTRRSKTS